MIEQSHTIEKLADALGKAQALMNGAVRDRKNPHFKSSYATLESAIDAARVPLTENGLSWVQMPGPLTGDGITVTTQIMHASGQWLRSSFTMPVAKRDPQAVGSAITYACRYAFMAALGLPPVDDDGEAAMPRGTDKPQKAAPPPATPFDDAPEKPSDIAREYIVALKGCTTMEALKDWFLRSADEIDALSDADKHALRSEYADKMNVLKAFETRKAA